VEHSEKEMNKKINFLVVELYFYAAVAIYCDMTTESRNSLLLGNGSVNTFPRKRKHATTQEEVFSVGATPRLYDENLRQPSRVTEFAVAAEN
jgi:hypothetical protein